MLEWFRKFGETKASRIFLGVLTLSFVAWGVGGYLMNATATWAVKVGNSEISAEQLDKLYRGRVNQLTQALGRTPTQEELKDNQIAEGVLGEAIARAVLRQQAHELGLLPATKQVQDEIAATPVFHGTDGAFDAKRYRAVLAQAGLSAEQFERETQQDLSTRLLAQLVDVAAITPTAVAPQAALENATLELDVATLDMKNEPTEAPTPAELQQHYELNAKLYQRPETRDVQVLEISRGAISGTVSVPEARIEEEYKTNQQTYALPEKRTVRHILLETEAKAKEVAGKVHSLADFEAQAKAESQDPGNAQNGGLLGNIDEASVVPAFGKAAFALPAGQVSAPVETPYGWHLIWVEKIEPARMPALAEVHDQIRDKITQFETDDAVNKLTEQVDEKIAAGEDLGKVAHEVGLGLRTLPQVSAADNGVDADIRAAAFATDEGEVSAPLQMKDGTAYVQVTHVAEASVPPLAEIKGRVATDWQNLQKQLKLKADAGKVLDAARAQSARPLAEAVKQSGVASVEVSHLEVKDLQSTPAWLHRQLLQVFQLPEGATVPTVMESGGRAYVVKLVSRQLAKPDAKMLQDNATLLHNRLQADLENMVIADMQTKSRISCNQVRLRQVFGSDVDCGY